MPWYAWSAIVAVVVATAALVVGAWALMRALVGSDHVDEVEYQFQHDHWPDDSLGDMTEAELSYRTAMDIRLP
jgi:hypothetical protein